MKEEASKKVGIIFYFSNVGYVLRQIDTMNETRIKSKKIFLNRFFFLGNVSVLLNIGHVPF